MRIERRRLTDQIIEQLITMIAEGKFAPGDKLPPEHRLMKDFGVGQSSLREAVGDLSLIGLLSVSPGRGALDGAPYRQKDMMNRYVEQGFGILAKTLTENPKIINLYMMIS